MKYILIILFLVSSVYGQGRKVRGRDFVQSAYDSIDVSANTLIEDSLSSFKEVLPIDIIAIGNSITRGTGGTGDTTSWVDYFNTRSNRNGWGINIVKYASGGSSISTIANIYYAIDDSIRESVNVVIFFGGTNDINADADVGNMTRTTQTLFDSIKADGSRIVTAGLMYNNGPTYVWDATDFGKVRTYNSWLEDNEDVDYYMDWRGTLGDSTSGIDTMYAVYKSSGSHPNNSGYDLISQIIDWKQLRDLSDGLFGGDDISIAIKSGELAATGTIDSIITYYGTRTDDAPNGVLRERTDTPGKNILKINEKWQDGAWVPIDTVINTTRTRDLPTVPVSGYAFWFVGDTVTATNDSVSTWNDISGNGNNATQSTVASRPVQQSTVANGWGALFFDRTNDFLDMSYSNADTNHTLYAVVKNDSSKTYDGYDMILDSQTGRLAFALQAATAGKSGIYDGVGAAEGTNSYLNDWHVLIFFYNDITGSQVTQANGITIRNSSTSERVIGGDVAIGARYDGGAHWLGGWIAEIIYYPERHFLVTADSLFDYFSDKYGMKE